MRDAMGIVGLGRMGGALARQAVDEGLRVVGYNRTEAVTREAAEDGIEPAYSYRELAAKLDPPRRLLLYVPHGKPTDAVLDALVPELASGDVVVDGGNAHWRDSVRRHAALKKEGLQFVDAGTSGGVEGARHGACFMVGGEDEAVAAVAPLLRALSVEGGFLHVGPPGSGHFVKLVHNAIEFAMVQAIAEGIELIEGSEYSGDLDLADVMHVWSRGSVIRGWLVELMEATLREHPGYRENLSSFVEDTKEGKWYVEYALEREVPIPTLALAELMFYRYREPDGVQAKIVALLRHGYGGHPLPARRGHEAEVDAEDAAAGRS